MRKCQYSERCPRCEGKILNSAAPSPPPGSCRCLTGFTYPGRPLPGEIPTRTGGESRLRVYNMKTHAHGYYSYTTDTITWD